MAEIIFFTVLGGFWVAADLVERMYEEGRIDEG